jgi:hypothetical protein
VEDASYPLGGSIVVVGRVDGEEFGDDFVAGGKTAVNVGEGSTSIDGEGVFVGHLDLMVVMMMGWLWGEG